MKWEVNMNRMPFVGAAVLGALIMLVAGCQSDKKYEQYEAQAKTMPVSCPHAEADLRMLQSEKVSTSKAAESGVAAVVPVSAVVGLISGTEGVKAQMATGEYNKVLDAKIAEIKTKCGIK
jgi:outer membrane murein-binding lipoprotein Lpp